MSGKGFCMSVWHCVLGWPQWYVAIQKPDTKSQCLKKDITCFVSVKWIISHPDNHTKQDTCDCLWWIWRQALWGMFQVSAHDHNFGMKTKLLFLSIISLSHNFTHASKTRHSQCSDKGDKHLCKGHQAFGWCAWLEKYILLSKPLDFVLRHSFYVTHSN